ncbi:hypothetical protein KZZ52_58170 [Dactylosporangium sp. AC04546]|uniref:hypothetical protein n=1 Tax=Dactylosporangium sp. AC04546 TaxID=2862460 RepID=UPI001EDF4EA0|nr:hypothetical protein [Dactylosporangium sp. AC04546]WVK83527.1 hypothetical protein KZZ52_58170 [Dactylosporangium sp. AC04546]
MLGAVALTAAVLPAQANAAPAAPVTAAAAIDPSTPQGTYFPLNPTRILDTREGNGAPKAPLGAGQTLHLQVGGRGGVPAANVSAVVLNLTATGPTSSGYLTVFPTGVARPTVSNLNFTAGWTGANAVTVPLGTGGKIDIYNPAGNISVIADVVGYYATATAPTKGGNYRELIPGRVLDTRDDGDGPVGPFDPVWVSVTIGDGSNDSHVRAFAVNITAVNGTLGGYLTAWNGVGTQPTASTLNFGRNVAVPNFAVVPTAPCDWTGCIGSMIGIYNGSGGNTDIIVDIVGYYDDSTLGGLRFNPITPKRITDTRDAGQHALGPASTTAFPATAVTTENTYSLVTNVTGIDPSNSTYLTLWSGEGTRPVVSNLNLLPHEVRANAAYVGVDNSFKYSVFNPANTVHMALDVTGTFELPVAASSAQAASAVGGQQATGTVHRN